MSQDDPLDVAAIRAALGDRRIGHRIVVFEETSSTNDRLAEMAPDTDEGLVVLAERQTGGRGQYGRRWESAARKGLWLSVLLRPRIAVSESSKLTDLLAHVIAAAIAEELAISATIKPPNDVYIAERKVAGVLVEMRVERGGGYCAIAGLGVNVNHASKDFPPELRDRAGSLGLATGKVINRSKFLITLLRLLDERYGKSAA